MSGQSPTVLQRSIAFKMIKLRKQARLSQGEAAEATGYSEATISHMETRKRTPQRKLILALLRTYNAEHEFQWFDEQLKLLRRKDWWDSLSGSKYPSGFDVYLGLEDGATSLGWWEPMIIPGLLQTENFARQMIAPDPYSVDPETVNAHVQLRLRRKEILTRSHAPVNLWVIVSEFALANIDGPGELHREQLDHLLELIRLPNVDFQVVPLGTNVRDGSRGPFTILKFDQPDDPGVVYVETQIRAVWFSDLEDITAYGRVMSHLHAGAMGTKESAMLIERYRKEVTT